MKCTKPFAQSWEQRRVRLGEGMTEGERRVLKSKRMLLGNNSCEGRSLSFPISYLSRSGSHSCGSGGGDTGYQELSMLVSFVIPGSVVEGVCVGGRGGIGCVLGVTWPGCSRFLIQAIVSKKAVARVQ